MSRPVSFSRLLTFRVISALNKPDIAQFIARASAAAVVIDRHHSTKREVKKLKITPNPPPGGMSDSIGPPDPKSNIRPIRFYIPPDETLTEKSFRLKRAEVLAWNQKFWEEHNSKFFKEKDDYVQRHQEEEKDTDGKKKSLSPEQMSVFYKNFLNENRVAHLHYNKEWYKKNISLLWPAFKVVLIRLKRKLSKSNR